VAGSPERLRARSGKTYDTVATLARGGMGEVLVAREHVSDVYERLVVLKTPLEHLCEDESFLDAFLDEARLGAQLRHPNIVQIHDVVELSGHPCIVMELLRGSDLRHISARLSVRSEAVPVDVTVTILMGVASALEYAHGAKDVAGRSLGVIHRDVSPHNVFVTRDGVVKLLDFGIARSTNRLTRTATGVIKGKLGYMAPELVLGRGMDHRGDLWALGVVAWETLTGRRLFPVDDRLGLVDAVMKTAIAPPSAVRSSVPPELDDIVMPMLLRDPDRRVQSAGAVLTALDGWARTHRAPGPRELAEWLDGVVPSSEDADFSDRPVTQTLIEAPAIEGEVSTTDLAFPKRGTKTLSPPTSEIDGAAATHGDRNLPAVREEAPTEVRRPAIDHELTTRRARPDRSSQLWIALVTLVVVAVAAGGIVMGGMLGRVADEPVAVAPTAQETIVIRVVGAPAGTTVLIDGTPRDDRRAVVRRDRRIHKVEVRRRDGASLLTRDVLGHEDATIHFVELPPGLAEGVWPRAPDAGHDGGQRSVPRPPRDTPSMEREPRELPDLPRVLGMEIDRDYGP